MVELNIKEATLERDLDNVGPAEAAHFDILLEDRQSACTHANLNWLAFAVSGTVQIDTVHAQILRLLQVVLFRIGRRLADVHFVQTLRLRLEDTGLVGHKSETTSIFGRMFRFAVITEFSW